MSRKSKSRLFVGAIVVCLAMLVLARSAGCS